MNSEGWLRRQGTPRARAAVAPMSPVSIPARLTASERPLEGLRDGRLEEPLAQADPQLTRQDLDHELGCQWIAPGEQVGQESRPAAVGRTRPRWRRTRRPHRAGPAGRSWPGRSRSNATADRPPRHPGRRNGRMPRPGPGPGAPARPVTAAAIADQPRPPRWSAHRLRRTAVRPGTRPRPATRPGPATSSSSARKAGLGGCVPAWRLIRSATSLQRHGAAMVYLRRPCSIAAGSRLDRGRADRPFDDTCPRTWVPFRRWHADPEVARLTRYQDGPMPMAEIDRFFQARVVGQTAGPGDPSQRVRAAHRDVRVQPARRRQRLGALPHHDRREGCLGAGLWQRGDRLDAEARQVSARPAPGGASVFSFNERAIRTYSARRGSSSRAVLASRSGATAGTGTSSR